MNITDKQPQLWKNMRWKAETAVSQNNAQHHPISIE